MELNEIPRYRIGPHDFEYIFPALMLWIESRYPYQSEGKQDIKAFPFGPYIPVEGKDESIDPCERQGEDNVVSRARRGTTDRQS